MSKEDMMNKISFALKDPVLQMGFEVICSKLSRLERENTELKRNLGLSIECEKAQKDGELCLGYGGDEDEPCEQCKNCIKCECGYYQLGETEKDEQLTKAKEIIKKLYDKAFRGIGFMELNDFNVLKSEVEQFIKEGQ